MPEAVLGIVARMTTPDAGARPVTPATACSGCGLVVPDGTDGCQRLFDDESVRQYGNNQLAARRRMVVDTYCLQHPERYCASAISLAAHLTGLCIALEHRSREQTLNDAIQRWLSRRPRLEKPPLPPTRGQMTIADVHAAADPIEHRAVVERWARGTWAAYAPLHPIARAWVASVDRR